MSKEILVTRSSMPGFEEYMEEIRDIWDTHWLTNMGSKHEKLRDELMAYLEVDGIELLTNGHMALELTMQALGLTGEVITTPYTFASTTHAIVRNGLKPVFCDISADDYTIDVTQIEDLITKHTSAIVPVHVYGNVCNIEEIERIAAEHNLKVIYDAAHAFGVKYKGQGIGNFGNASCFSFHATKVFHTIEGGAVSFKEKSFGEKLYQLKNFGIRDAEHVDGIGANAKMNEFCAAMGLCNLRHIEEEIKKREKIVKQYRNYLDGIEGLRLNPVQRAVQPNYAYFPVMFEKNILGVSRDEVFAALAENGIGARKYFYPVISAFDCYKDMYDAEQTPVALKCSREVLALPLYPDLNAEDVDRICGIILKCLGKL